MRRLGVTAVLLLVGGCGNGNGMMMSTNVDVFTMDEWAKISKLSPLPDLLPDTTNKYADNAMAATFGQRLFMDKAFSGPIKVGDDGKNGANGAVGETGKVACVSCHQPANYFMDRRTMPNNTSIGVDYMIRNAASAINSSYYVTWCERDGVRDTQWSDSLTDPEDPTSMGGSRLLVAHVLYKKYKSDYEAIFGPLDKRLDPNDPNAAQLPATGLPGDMGNFDNMAPADKVIINTIFANFGKAVQAYVRKLISKNAPFDQYVAKNFSAISPAAKRGLGLFIGKANCTGCHSGPAFTDTQFHDVGMVQMGVHTNNMETGRFDAIPVVLGIEFNSNGDFSDDKSSHRLDGVAQMPTDKGKWRTTGLREVAETAPYMHTGQMATLDDVVTFYNNGGDPSGYIGTRDMLITPLNLTDGEKSDLVEFMKTLTGDPITGQLAMDTSAP
jgi:cytochrome c peroxidase